jgi:hypothetical protein
MINKVQSTKTETSIKMIESFKENHVLIVNNKTKNRRFSFVGPIDAGNITYLLDIKPMGLLTK